MAQTAGNEPRRAVLGIDGNCGFALLGDDLQSGECEFVEIKYSDDRPDYVSEIVAAKAAYRKLAARLNREFSFYFGPSHPYGS